MIIINRFNQYLNAFEVFLQKLILCEYFTKIEVNGKGEGHQNMAFLQVGGNLFYFTTLLLFLHDR